MAVGLVVTVIGGALIILGVALSMAFAEWEVVPPQRRSPSMLSILVRAWMGVSPYLLALVVVISTVSRFGWWGPDVPTVIFSFAGPGGAVLMMMLAGAALRLSPAARITGARTMAVRSRCVGSAHTWGLGGDGGRWVGVVLHRGDHDIRVRLSVQCRCR